MSSGGGSGSRNNSRSHSTSETMMEGSSGAGGLSSSLSVGRKSSRKSRASSRDRPSDNEPLTLSVNSRISPFAIDTDFPERQRIHRSTPTSSRSATPHYPFPSPSSSTSPTSIVSAGSSFSPSSKGDYITASAARPESYSSLTSSVGVSSPLTNLSNDTSTTIGNLSQSSVPLLSPHIKTNDYSFPHPTERRGSVATVGSRLGDSSDTSSVHSYPPQLRMSQQTTSSIDSGGRVKESALDNWKNWAKEIEMRGRASESRREEVQQTTTDPWHYLAYGDKNGASGARRPSLPTSNVATTPSIKSKVYSGSIASTSSWHRASPAVTRSPHITTTNSFSNPLAPFRKRLARSLGTGKRVGVELQLLVELIDALESYINAFCAPGRNGRVEEGDENAEVGYINEVTSLVKELVEVAPDAQRCFTDGAYGPLAFPGSGTVSQLRNWGDGNHGSSSWWPRRLARDCRAVLEEVGFPTSTVIKGMRNGGGAGATVGAPRATTPVGIVARSGRSGSSAGQRVTEEDEGQERRKTSIPEAQSSSDAAVVAALGLEEKNVLASSSTMMTTTTTSSSSTSSLPLTTNGGGTVRGQTGFNETSAAAARREELLEEGKRRWNAFRKRQNLEIDPDGAF